MPKTTATRTQSPPPMGSAFDLIRPSIQKVKKNWKAFALVNILIFVTALRDTTAKKPDSVSIREVATEISGYISGLSGLQLAGLVGGGLLIIFIFMSGIMFLQAMMTNLEVKASAGKQPSIRDLVKDAKKYFWRLFGLFLAMGWIIIGGLFLLIVPGIIATGRLVMAPYHMVDKDLSIGEALRQSNEQAKQHSGKIWAAIGVMVLVGLGLGIIDFVPLVGPFLAAVGGIATSLVIALRYQQLKSKEFSAPTPSAAD